VIGKQIRRFPLRGIFFVAVDSSALMLFQDRD
jgi:hypothetical protein